MQEPLKSQRGFADHPYASFVHNVERPARYVGGEWGQVCKDWESAGARMCLAFPDIYDLGMSHLGTRILYAILNEASDTLCERAFVPWEDMEGELRARGLPLVSLENARPLRDFDVVGISLQHELVFTNVLTLLDLGGIRLRACDRTDDEPLVLGGGSVATHPEPIAPFFDAMVVGDGERKALEVLRRWAEDKRSGLKREDRLRRLASLGGVYVPSLYERGVDEASGRMVVQKSRFSEAPLPVTRELIKNLDEYPFPELFPTGGPEAVFERLSLEISRGCMQGCRFCQGGMIFRPERERNPNGLIETLVEALKKSGQDEISLTSLSTADYSCIGPLVRAVSDRTRAEHVSLAVSSLRAYGLTDETLDDIRGVRATGLTFAPEAGTQRLRDVINKNVTEEQILSTVERVLTRGWDRVKLYFMIGLPTETKEDVEGIVETTRKARDAGRRARKGGRSPDVNASVSTFVPKPHTPFQWEAMDGLEVVRDKQYLLKSCAKDRRVELKMHESHGSILEGVLSRGDIRLADVIEQAWRGGARFDAWDGKVRWDLWTGAMKECGVEIPDYLRELPVESTLAWSHINVGLKNEFLLKERSRAQIARTSPPCGRELLRAVDEDSLEPCGSGKKVCYRCGAECDLDAVKPTLVQAPEAPEASAEPVDDVALQTSIAEPIARVPGPAAKPAGGFRYRFRFMKVGRAAMLGHLDLVREVPRILRRAGVPLWYSQGFHPKPIMTFGPALSLGVPSLEEYVDIKTATTLELGDALLDRINQTCPDGIRFAEVKPLSSKEEAVVNVLKQARYLVGLAREEVELEGGASWVEKRVGELLALEHLELERKTKDGKRVIDIRSLIDSLSLGDSSDENTLKQAGIRGTWVVVRASLRLTHSGTARIDEVVQAIAGRKLLARAVRVGMTS